MRNENSSPVHMLSMATAMPFKVRKSIVVVTGRFHIVSYDYVCSFFCVCVLMFVIDSKCTVFLKTCCLRFKGPCSNSKVFQRCVDIPCSVEMSYFN